jgi:hypothetical protein
MNCRISQRHPLPIPPWLLVGDQHVVARVADHEQLVVRERELDASSQLVKRHQANASDHPPPHAWQRGNWILDPAAALIVPARPTVVA